jgi:hypothetical protein
LTEQKPRKLKMIEILFVASAFVLMGGVAMLYGDNRAKAKAAIAAGDAASLAAYQRQLDATAAWIDDHRDRGELPKMICDEVPTGFDQDEEVLCVLPSIDLMELRAVRYSIRRGRSAYGGPTIRVARGLSFRLGGSDSIGHTMSESTDELRQIDNGTLVLTTKRLAFLGSLRTNNSSLDDLMSVGSASKRRRRRGAIVTLRRARNAEGPAGVSAGPSELSVSNLHHQSRVVMAGRCRSAQVSSKTTSCGAAKPSRNRQNNENDERIRKSRSLPTGNAWRALNADPPDTDLFVRWCGRGGVARHPRALRRSLTAASGIRSLTSAHAWPKCAGACGDAC